MGVTAKRTVSDTYAGDRADLSTLVTEHSDPVYRNLHRMSAADLAAAMNAEDQTVPEAVRKALPSIAAAATVIEAGLAHGGRLVYVGAGTSGRLAVLDASECVPTFGTSPSQVQAVMAGGVSALASVVESVEDDADTGAQDLRDRDLRASDTVVGVSASGRTPYVLGAMTFAQTVGTSTIGISCNHDTALSAAVHHPIEVVVGPEILTGSTRLKAGTAQKLVLNMLSTIAMVRSGRAYGNLMVDLTVSNEKLRQRATRIVQQVSGCSLLVATEALAQSDYEIKTAIVMVTTNCDPSRSRSLLARSNNRLDIALEGT